MPEGSTVAVPYGTARSIKMPRNGVNKKDLDIRIGFANLPVSQHSLLDAQIRNALHPRLREEEYDRPLSHILELGAERQCCCRDLSFSVCSRHQ
jgi:hypothetical protein